VELYLFSTCVPSWCRQGQLYFPYLLWENFVTILKKRRVEEDISCGVLLYTVCLQCARSCLTYGTASLNNFRIHESLSFALLIAVTPWIPSLRLWSIIGVLTSPVSDCWQALLYRRLWIPVPGINRTWDGGLGEQDIIPCQAASKPAVAPLWWHSKGEVM